MEVTGKLWSASYSAALRLGKYPPLFTSTLVNNCKNSGTFKEKKIHLKKSLTLVLHQAIKSLIIYPMFKYFLNAFYVLVTPTPVVKQFLALTDTCFIIFRDLFLIEQKDTVNPM